VSIVTFVAWTLLPFVDASRRRSPTSRAITVGNGVVTVFGFVAAGLTQRSDSPNKGIAQRLFLGSVFAWYMTSAFRCLFRSSDNGEG
jgi:quinol-cytochrome oxidoreductase complex cytochrome b subunit